MTKLQEAQAKLTQKMGQLDDLIKKNDDPASTADDRKALKAMSSEVEAIQIEVKDLREIEDIAKKQAERLLDARQVNPSDRPANFGNGGSANADASNILSVSVPAICKGRTPKTLMRITGGNREEAQKAAFSLAKFVMATCHTDPQFRANAQEWCTKNGIVTKAAQAENSNTSGGFLVPIELANYVIQLMEEFGVCRRLMKKDRMMGDTKDIPRRSGTVSAYWLTDNQAITASAKTFDMISLTAKKLATFVYYSNEIAEDAMIDIGDDLANEIAWNFSATEDMAGFNGDGTSKYGGILGLVGAFANAFPSGGAGIVVGTAGSGSAWSSYHLTDFNLTQGALPQYVWKRGKPTWYCTQQFYYNVMVALAAAAGGNTILSIMKGPDGQPMFLGCPVEFVQVLPSAASISTIDAYFGDISLSSTFGDRRTLTVALSDQIGFAADQLAIRGITRLDINNHDVGGNNAATLAQNPTYDQSGATYYAGPLVALKSAAS